MESPRRTRRPQHDLTPRSAAARVRALRAGAAIAAAALAMAGCGASGGPPRAGGAARDASDASRRADKDCSDFASQADAQKWLDARSGDPDHLDGDGNGVACESMGAGTAGAARRVGAAKAMSRPGRVVAVVDGDTIKVRVNGAVETVRLIGIDTPESKRPETPVECGAKRAGAAMHKLLDGRTVTLRRDPTQDATDKYGRTLAYVDFGGRDAGEQMIHAGWAKPYVYEHVPFRRVRAYRAAESAAARARAGVHGACAGDFHRAA